MQVLRLYLILILIVAAAGCTKLKFLPQLLTLKDLADTQEATDKYVEHKDNIFAELVSAAKDQSINQYKNKESVFEAFEEPIMIKHVQEKSPIVEFWVYRRPVEFFESDRVYFYFDKDDQVVEWKYVQGEG